MAQKRDSKTGEYTFSKEAPPTPVVAAKKATHEYASNAIQGEATLSTSVVEAAKIFTALEVEQKPEVLEAGISPLRFGAPFASYFRDGRTGEDIGRIIYQHIANDHCPTPEELEILNKILASSEGDFYTKFNKWHEGIHAEELDILLYNKAEFFASDSRHQKPIHYHANDHSQDSEIMWVRASHLLGHSIHYKEESESERQLTKEEGKQAVLARKVTEDSSFILTVSAEGKMALASSWEAQSLRSWMTRGFFFLLVF